MLLLLCWMLLSWINTHTHIYIYILYSPSNTDQQDGIHICSFKAKLTPEIAEFNLHFPFFGTWEVPINTSNHPREKRLRKALGYAMWILALQFTWPEEVNIQVIQSDLFGMGWKWANLNQPLEFSVVKLSVGFRKGKALPEAANFWIFPYRTSWFSKTKIMGLSSCWFQLIWRNISQIRSFPQG